MLHEQQHLATLSPTVIPSTKNPNVNTFKSIWNEINEKNRETKLEHMQCYKEKLLRKKLNIK